MPVHVYRKSPGLGKPQAVGLLTSAPELCCSYPSTLTDYPSMGPQSPPPYKPARSPRSHHSLPSFKLLTSGSPCCSQQAANAYICYSLFKFKQLTVSHLNHVPQMLAYTPYLNILKCFNLKKNLVSHFRSWNYSSSCYWWI